MTTCARCGKTTGPGLAWRSWASQTTPRTCSQLRTACWLTNQADIGNAVKPYYGEDAGNKLTDLLKQHIQTAVGVLQAAKTGDPAQLNQAKAAFYANGNQIANFLTNANPQNWPRDAVQNMMKTHLDQVVQMGSDELTHHYPESVNDWNAYRDHFLAMADTLSNGIVKQFPNRFS